MMSLHLDQRTRQSYPHEDLLPSFFVQLIGRHYFQNCYLHALSQMCQITALHGDILPPSMNAFRFEKFWIHMEGFQPFRRRCNILGITEMLLHECPACFLRVGRFLLVHNLYSLPTAQQSSPFSPTLLLVSLTRFLVSLTMTRLLVAPMWLLISPTLLTALLPHCLFSSLTATPARACPYYSLAAAPARLL